VEQGLETGKKVKNPRYFHQVNDRKVLVVFNSAISEGLQLYSQI
jgi:hypothetical protein